MAASLLPVERLTHRGSLGGVKLYYVYILASRSRVLYIGVTNSLERRCIEHRATLHSSSFTARYRVDRLVHFEEFTDVRQAIGREKQLKRWGRSKKVWLIEQWNPNWMDFFEQPE